MEKATYSYKNVNECIDKIKTLNTTARTKKDHFPIAFEVKKVYDFCYDKTGCCLFETRYSDCEDYMKLLSMEIEHKKVTKKALDELLKRSVRFLQREILSIKAVMDTGEVNTIL